jgi:hypothetical protein
MMQAIIGALIALVGVFFYKKMNTSQSDLAVTKAKDQQLQDTQKTVQDAIKDLDDGIRKIKENQIKTKEQIDKETLQQAADNLKKGLQ